MKRKLIFKAILLTLLVVLLVKTDNARAQSGNAEHQLLVYSIEDYAQYNDYYGGAIDWKGEIPLSSRRDPYEGFWEVMYSDCGTGPECAATSSRRRKNAEIDVKSMVSASVG